MENTHWLKIIPYTFRNKFIKAIEIISDRLKTRPQTIIHNDLLPINIVSENRCNTDVLKIIDWGNAALGCYAHDLGRLVGDLKPHNGSFDYWVNKNWHKEILKTYYETINSFNGINLIWGNLLFDFKCAKLCNYAGIVMAHIKNDWSLSSWYEINLESVIDLSNEIVELKKK